MTKKCFRLFEDTFLRADWCSQFVRELCYAVRQEFCAAARPLHTGPRGICCHTTGPSQLDRASSLMATWSPPEALPQDSMPGWLSRHCCGGTQSLKKVN